MPEAIITGAGGFIGLHLTEELMAHGYKIYALCRENGAGQNRLPSDADIFTDINKLPPADIFYHLAWESASGAGRGDPLVQTKNAELTVNALLAAHRLGCKRFVGLGTLYEKLAPQIEEAGNFGGSDFYILSKAYSHKMADRLALKLGADFVWATICHPIGKGIKKDQMLALVISDILRGVSTPTGPAATLYDILSVRDVARGLRLLGREQALSRREYYIGSGEAKYLCQWLYDTANILGSDVSPAIGRRPGDGLRFDPSWFDITPIEKDTGYRPAISFPDAVRETANSFTIGSL